MQIDKTDAEMQRQIIRESDFLQAACFDRLLLSVEKLTGAHTLQKTGIASHNTESRRIFRYRIRRLAAPMTYSRIVRFFADRGNDLCSEFIDA